MPVISSPRHVLAVHSVAASSTWYQETLGFEEFVNIGEDWRFLRRDGVIVMLGQCPDEVPASENGNHSYFAYWHVDDVDTLHKEWCANGVEISKPLSDEPWGMREFGVRTNDGHRILIGQEIS